MGSIPCPKRELLWNLNEGNKPVCFYSKLPWILNYLLVEFKSWLRGSYNLLKKLIKHIFGIGVVHFRLCHVIQLRVVQKLRGPIFVLF